jgi:hypothetical protein
MQRPVMVAPNDNELGTRRQGTMKPVASLEGTLVVGTTRADQYERNEFAVCLRIWPGLWKRSVRDLEMRPTELGTWRGGGDQGKAT